jgi:mono/diheme cytochrome c family protein
MNGSRVTMQELANRGAESVKLEFSAEESANWFMGLVKLEIGIDGHFTLILEPIMSRLGSPSKRMGQIGNRIGLTGDHHGSCARSGFVPSPRRASSGWMQRFLTCKRCSFIAMVALGVACASTPRGATEANFASARSSAPEGWAAYKQRCAGCHGERGESVTSAPRVMGAGALPEYPRERKHNADPAAGDPELLRLQAQSRPAGAPWRDPFRTAQDVYNYVSEKMPLPADRAGSLSEEEYWSIINFMLLAHGVAVPPEGVTAANASSVKL